MGVLHVTDSQYPIIKSMTLDVMHVDLFPVMGGYFAFFFMDQNRLCWPMSVALHERLRSYYPVYPGVDRVGSGEMLCFRIGINKSRKIIIVSGPLNSFIVRYKVSPAHKVTL